MHFDGDDNEMAVISFIFNIIESLSFIISIIKVKKQEHYNWN